MEVDTQEQLNEVMYGEPQETTEAVVEETPAEEPQEVVEEQIDYEKRFKDGQRFISQQGNEIGRLRQQAQEAERRDIDRERRMMELEARINQQQSQQPPPYQQEQRIDPLADDQIFSERERETFKEFGDLTDAFRKMSKQEAARAIRDNVTPEMRQMLAGYQEKLATYESENKSLQNKFAENERIRNAEGMLSNYQRTMQQRIGSNYAQIDEDPRFHDFVNSDPAYKNVMMNSLDPVQHSLVMSAYLNKNPHLYKDNAQSLDNKRNTALASVSDSRPIQTQKVDPNTLDSNDLMAYILAEEAAAKPAS